MKRDKILRPRLFSAAPVALALVTAASALASCAATEADDGHAPVDPVVVPEAGADASLAADVEVPPDGGCDASDPTCMAQPITCAEAAFCPVPTGVSAIHALTAVWGSSKDDVWAVGSGGTIVHWDGAVWTAAPQDQTKNTFRAVWGSGPNDVWVASATDTIFHTTGFAGGPPTWTRAPMVSDDDFGVPVFTAWGVAGGAPRFGGQAFVRFDDDFEVSFINQIIATRDAEGGIAWIWDRGAGRAMVNGMWGSSADDVWVVGDDSTWDGAFGWTAHGTRTGDGDLVWTEVDSRAGAVLRAVWGSSADDVWAVGDAGKIRRIGANKTAWEIVPSPTPAVLRAVWGAAADDVWAVGDHGTILHWDGAAWKPSLAAFPANKKKPHLYGIWGSGPNDVWIVGDGIALRHTGGVK